MSELKIDRPLNLSREDAKIQLRYGSVLTHKYFDQDEYVRQIAPTTYLLSGKYKVSTLMFWADRSGPGFDDGWEFYKGEVK